MTTKYVVGSPARPTSTKVTVTKKPINLVPKKIYTSKGWYVGGKAGSGFPTGVKCSLCNKGAKEDEVVYAFQISSDYGGKRRIVQHKECMESVLVKSPYTQFEIIKQRVADGGNFFE